MSYLNIGVSALRAAQVGINNTTHNIANAGTDGYSRQRVEFGDRGIQFQHRKWQGGGGVDATSITSLRDNAVESAITNNISLLKAAEFRGTAFQQLESAFADGPGSLHEAVNDFFSQVELLAANPSETVLRQEVVSASLRLANGINKIADAFRAFNGDARARATTAVNAVNELSGQILTLNQEIQVAEARGQLAHGLINERGRLINRLAEFVDVNTSQLNSKNPVITGAGGGLLIGMSLTELSVSESPSGGIQIDASSGLTGLPVSGGALGGLVQATNSVQLGVQTEFEHWATSVLSFLDEIQATGLASPDSVTALTGSRLIRQIDLPLANAETVYPMQEGQLAISVADPVGNRTTHVIEIDPTVDSLRDVVERINSLNGVTAVVSDNGRVIMQAGIGFAFDFAGRPDQYPQSASMVGTALPTIGGTYQDWSNTTLTAEVVIGGEVSVTDGLKFRVTDSEGAVIGTFNAGLGYGAGEPIDLGNGIQVTFPPGTLEFGDTFTISANGRPDTSGFLAAAGLGTLFSGDRLTEIRLNSDIENDPALIAVSRTGAAGDGSQISRLVQVRDEPLFSEGTENTSERLASMTGFVGIMVESQQQEIEQRELQRIELENARDAVSGVDVNEEMLQLIEFQRAFQAASRFVSTIEETMDDLFRIL